MNNVSPHKNRVFVAMSGGVDSSVAAMMLKVAGYDVEGITMSFALAKASGQDAVIDAERVCRALGITHHVVDLSAVMEEEVVGYFAAEYAAGRTPNPCVICNRQVKFGVLFDEAKKRGADLLATGHYARLSLSPRTDAPAIWKAKDVRKDQSYFLWNIRQEILPHIIFPLGEMNKSEVREVALRADLPVAERPDSQDICFIPDGKYQDFLKSRAPHLTRPGNFLDKNGEVIGQHNGIMNYTVGQREGLGIALGYPAYVFKIDVAHNSIYVGPRERLFCSGLVAKEANLTGVKLFEETVEAGVKIRYNPYEIRSLVKCLDENRIHIQFSEPQAAVTPGQSVVFYDGEMLLGGAVIEEPQQN